MIHNLCSAPVIGGQNPIKDTAPTRECVRNLDLQVQVHPGELWVSKQWVHIQNKKDLKNLGYPTKKQSFSL